MSKGNFFVYINKLDQRLLERYGETLKVEYSAYENDADDMPIDNLDEVPIEGKVRFMENPNEIGGAPWVSGIYNSPTWLELVGIAQEKMEATGDTHHCFLEGVNVLRRPDKEGGCIVARLVMGS